MTPKQQRFVEEYLVDRNGTQAATRAGYSAKTANEQASRLLANVSVAAAVAAATAKVSERLGISTQYVLDRLMIVADKCTEAETFNPAGANGALGLLGKHLGMFTEKVDVNHGVQDSLAALMEKIDGKSRGIPS